MTPAVERAVSPRARRIDGKRVTTCVTCASSALLVAALACANIAEPRAVLVPDTLVALPSFARDIEPIFEARCATVSCHNRATHQLGLTLTPDTAYGELVNVPSLFYPGVMLVRPSMPDSSWLVNIISEDSLRRFGHPRMPLGRDPLTDRQIQTIINWIAQGALRN